MFNQLKSERERGRRFTENLIQTSMLLMLLIASSAAAVPLVLQEAKKVMMAMAMAMAMGKRIASYSLYIRSRKSFIVCIHTCIHAYIHTYIHFIRAVWRQNSLLLFAFCFLCGSTLPKINKEIVLF